MYHGQFCMFLWQSGLILSPNAVITEKYILILPYVLPYEYNSFNSKRYIIKLLKVLSLNIRSLHRTLLLLLGHLICLVISKYVQQLNVNLVYLYLIFHINKSKIKYQKKKLHEWTKCLHRKQQHLQPWEQILKCTILLSIQYTICKKLTNSIFHRHN